MCPDDLHSFITLLEEADELVRVDALVDPHLEIATIVDRVSKGAGRGRALLFEHVKGSELPVAANLFGRLQRVAWALGTTDLQGLADQFARDLQTTAETDSERALEQLLGQPRYRPEIAAADCFTHDMTEQGLTALPSLHSWPGDGGRYLTLGQVFTGHPDGGLQNCGMYRLQILDRTRTVVHWRSGSGGARHLQAWRETGRPMPVAIALGGPPVLTWTAGLPLPSDVAETAFAAYLCGRPVQLASCQTSALCVPATAEIVIEGEILPDEQHPEGPFGNHTGQYVPAAPAPVIQVKRIFCRERAVCPATVVGPPPMEDLHLAEAAERLFLPLLQHDHPWVRDVHMPLPGIFHRAALVAIDPLIAKPAKTIAAALWRALLLKDSRLLILLDADENLRDPARVYWRVVNSPGWTERVLVDPQRLVIDARRSGQSITVAPDSATLRRVLERWAEYRLD